MMRIELMNTEKMGAGNKSKHYFMFAFSKIPWPV